MNNKQFLIVISITFIVIIIWIIADILHTKPSVEVNPKLSTLLAPIDPNFDPKVISQIKEITPVSELKTEQFQPTFSSTKLSSTSGQPINPNQTPLPLPSAAAASISALQGGNQ